MLKYWEKYVKEFFTQREHLSNKDKIMIILFIHKIKKFFRSAV
jgi:hypothetical protein